HRVFDLGDPVLEGLLGLLAVGDVLEEGVLDDGAGREQGADQTLVVAADVVDVLGAELAHDRAELVVELLAGAGVEDELEGGEALALLAAAEQTLEEAPPGDEGFVGHVAPSIRSSARAWR